MKRKITKLFLTIFWTMIALLVPLRLVLVKADTAHVPFIPDNGISNGIIEVWYPMHPEWIQPGVFTLKDATTQTIYEVPITWSEPGPANGAGVYYSGLPKFNGMQVIMDGVMGDGQHIYTNNNDVFLSTLFRIRIALIARK